MDLEKLNTYLEDFKSKMDSKLKDVQNCKDEIARMKQEVYDQLQMGRYIRDEESIVLSAPRIVIGNVDSRGNLLSSTSSVLVRGCKVKVEGVSEIGSIDIAAPHITERAVDKGYDGLEDVVRDSSFVITQARSVVLDARTTNKDPECKGTFPDIIAPPEGIVQIHGDKNVNVEAATRGTKAKEDIGKRINDTDKMINALNSSLTQMKTNVKTNMDAAKKLLSDEDKYIGTDLDRRSNSANLELLNEKFRTALKRLSNAMDDYYCCISQIAELKRQKKSLTKDKDALTPKDEKEYKTKGTGAAVNIAAETIAITAKDADGNLRTNQDSGVYIQSNAVSIHSYGTYDATSKTMELLPYSSVSISSNEVYIDTCNLSDIAIDKNKNEAVSNPVGHVSINSKDITLESYKKKDTRTWIVDNDTSKVEAKSEVLGYPEAKKGGDAKGGDQQKKDDKGTILVKANAVNVEAVDKDAKADGTISLNAKRTELTALDAKGTDKEAKEATAGSVFKVYAEKISTGLHGEPKDKKFSKTVQTAAEKLVSEAKEDIVLYSNDVQSLVQITKDKVEVSSKNDVKLYGKTTINGETSFSGNVNVKGAIEAAGVKANSGLKTPNTTEKVVTKAPANTSTAKEAAKPENVDKK